MRILITGGTGLIGRALCTALLARGHALTVLSRRPATVAARCGAAVRAMGTLAEWTPDTAFDAVINLAGEPIIDAAWTLGRRKRLWDSRVGVTEALIGRIAAARVKPRVLLSGSAVGCYGDAGDAVLDEDAPGGNDFGATLCQAWEQAARQAASFGVRVCFLRTGLVLDARGGMLGRMLLPFRLGLGTRLGTGMQWMSWIAMDDYVALVLELLGRDDAVGAFNMTAPQPVRNREFTALLARALHRPAPFVAPAWLLRLALGERAILLLGGQRALPTRALALGYHFRHPEAGAALAALTAGGT